MEFLPTRVRALLVIGGFVWLLIVTLLDELTGPQLSLGLFYLIPVAWVAWFGSQRAAILVAACSAFSRFLVQWHEGVDFWPKTVDGERTFASFWNGASELLFFLLFTLMILRIKGQLDRERALARIDTLSKVHNARSFRELAEAEVERARRYGRTFSLVYIDLDNFKQVNDTLGHAAGDALLCLVAEVLQDNTRHVDVVARLGGDEFALVLPETGSAGTWAVLQRIRHKLVSQIAERNYPVTASMGAACFLEAPASLDEALQKADEAMYFSKQHGKDRIEVREFGRQLTPTV
jgi:diguanylate cyclase (GGDEF)-like protein